MIPVGGRGYRPTINAASNGEPQSIVADAVDMARLRQVLDRNAAVNLV